MKRRMVLVLVCMLLIGAVMATTISASASSVVQILKVNVDGARVRSSAAGHPIITSLKKGTRVFYLNQYIGGMCKIRTVYGQEGYVYRDYLSAYGAVLGSQVYAAKYNTAVYNAQGRRIGTLPKYYHVLVYEIRGNWAYVKNLNGKGGIVKLSAIARAGL